MEPKPVQGRVPELVVEKLALGEASPEQMRLASPEDQARAAALQDDNAEILMRYPPHKLATQIRYRVAATSPAAPPRSRGGPLLLERALPLVDAPPLARCWLLTADEAHRSALSVSVVLASARAVATDGYAAETAPRALPTGLIQESFLLRKKAR